ARGKRAPGGRRGGHERLRFHRYAVRDRNRCKVLITLRLARHLNRKIGGADVIRLLENHRALDGVLQFADVSGPVVGQQQVASLLRDAPETLSKAEVVTLDEEVHERKNVLLPVPQRRNENGDDTETIEKVLA